MPGIIRIKVIHFQQLATSMGGLKDSLRRPLPAFFIVCNQFVTSGRLFSPQRRRGAERAKNTRVLPMGVNIALSAKFHAKAAKALATDGHRLHASKAASQPPHSKTGRRFGRFVKKWFAPVASLCGQPGSSRHWSPFKRRRNSTGLMASTPNGFPNASRSAS